MKYGKAVSCNNSIQTCDSCLVSWVRFCVYVLSFVKFAGRSLHAFRVKDVRSGVA